MAKSLSFERLHKVRKLVLLVDLDQTIIHTTQNRPSKLNKHTISFQLNKNEPWLWTRLRQNIKILLINFNIFFSDQIAVNLLPACQNYSKCTLLLLVRVLMPIRLHEFQKIKLEKKLDTSEKQSLFSHRILSRDECVDPYHKSGNLKHLFPADDSMVAIIDERADV